MLKTSRSVVRVGSMLLFFFLIALLPACQTINVQCPGGGGRDGAGGCLPPVPANGQIRQGTPCNTGNVCRIENQPNCSSINSTWTCQTVNNGGFCECKCQQ